MNVDVNEAIQLLKTLPGPHFDNIDLLN